MLSGKHAGETRLVVIAWVNGYIKKRKPDALCNACIADDLGLGQQEANRAIMVLGAMSEFTQETGVCAECGKEQKVTSCSAS